MRRSSEPRPVSNASPAPGRAPAAITPAYPVGAPPNSATRAVLKKLGVSTVIRLKVKVDQAGKIDITLTMPSGYDSLDNAVLYDLKT